MVCQDKDMEAENIAAICQALPLGKVAALSLDYEAFAAGDWHTAFSHAHLLQDVTVRGPAVRSMVASTFGSQWCQTHGSGDDYLTETWRCRDVDYDVYSLPFATKITLSRFNLDDLKFGDQFPSGLDTLRAWYKTMQARAVPLRQLVVTSVQQPHDGPPCNLDLLRQDGIVVDEA